MGRHRQASGSGVGSRLLPSLIAAALIVVGAFGVGVIAGVVLPEPSHPTRTPLTLPSEAAPGSPAGAGEVRAGIEAEAVARPTPTVAPAPSPVAGGTSRVQSPVPAASASAPATSPSTAPASAPTPAAASTSTLPGRGRHHGRPWLRPRRR